MQSLKGVVVGALLCWLAVVGNSQPDAGELVLFYNGQIITMEADQPLAQALAVRGDRILAVGSNEAILALADRATHIIDLQGNTMMPGFVDAHTHIFNNSEFWGATPESVQQIGLSNGITTLGNLYSMPEFIAEMRALEAQGKLRIRTSLYMQYTTNCGEITDDWYKQYPQQLDPNRMLRILGVKIFADGGSCLRPAISFEYADNGGHGDLFLTDEQLNQAVQEAHESGYQVAIHAQGDLAIEQACS